MTSDPSISQLHIHLMGCQRLDPEEEEDHRRRGVRRDGEVFDGGRGKGRK